MFLLDDILLAPFHGIMLIFREIHKGAMQEKIGEAMVIRTRLSELYKDLETGLISESDFDRLEGELLDRLDSIEGEEINDEESQPSSNLVPDPGGPDLKEEPGFLATLSIEKP
jgi:hypothetical protein